MKEKFTLAKVNLQSNFKIFAEGKNLSPKQSHYPTFHKCDASLKKKQVSHKRSEYSELFFLKRLDGSLLGYCAVQYRRS
jgi:hypothetical protein